jgi:hypothetical protein
MVLPLAFETVWKRCRFGYNVLVSSSLGMRWNCSTWCTDASDTISTGGLKSILRWLNICNSFDAKGRSRVAT